jgi:hypothetical protein
MTLYDRAMQSVGEQMDRLNWLDADGDGRVDDGEADYNAGASLVVGGTFTDAYAANVNYPGTGFDR